MTPPAPRPDWAYFLDFDGTLVDIHARPDGISVDPALPDLLLKVSRSCGGALALVSGRPIAELDAFLPRTGLATCGQHGAERRRADGETEVLFRPTALDTAVESIRRFCTDHSGVLMEEKTATVTLHYRGAPAVEGAAVALMEELENGLAPDYRLQRGKMVLELKPASRDKGRAIEAFLEEEPFAGRRPVMIGDDLTDEDGFRVANRYDGIAIRVGRLDERETEARFSLGSPAAVRSWLARLT